jgi:hypothetical protein
MGLEPLALGDERGSRVTSVGSGHGSRQSSISGLEAVGAPHARHGSRTPSIGNLRQAGAASEPLSAPGQGQSTFDDILKGMKTEKKKKRSFF